MSYALGVTGYPGSGKSIVMKIAEDIGFKTVSMGDQIRKRTEEDWRERLNRAEDESTDEIPSDVYGEYATEMRQKHGRGIVSKWCKDDVIGSDVPVLIDGMRSPEELVSFEEYTDIDVLFIHAPASLRFDWIKERARNNEDLFTVDSFMNRDKRENGWGLNELIQNSDYTIHNCMSEEQFSEDVTNFLKRKFND